METAMTIRRKPKKSLGNLLREEVQKDKEPEAEPLGTPGQPDPAPPPERSTQGDPQSPSPPQRGTARTTQRSKAAAQPETAPEVAQSEVDQAEPFDQVNQKVDQEVPDYLPKPVEPAVTPEPVTPELVSTGLVSTNTVEPATVEVSIPTIDLTTEPSTVSESPLPEQEPPGSELDSQAPELNPIQSTIHLSPLTTMETPRQPQTSTLSILPRSATFQTLALPRAFTRPIIDRPAPWEIPNRPLVITGSTASFPTDLSDEDLGWFD